MNVIEIVKDYLGGGFTKEEVLKIVEHHYKKGEIEDEEYAQAKQILEQADETEDVIDDEEEEVDEEKEFARKLYGNDFFKKL